MKNKIFKPFLKNILFVKIFIFDKKYEVFYESYKLRYIYILIIIK